MVVKIYILYNMYITCTQSSEFDRWIKVNFDLKWTLSYKNLSCTFQKKLLAFKIAKKFPPKKVQCKLFSIVFIPNATNIS